MIRRKSQVYHAGVLFFVHICEFIRHGKSIEFMKGSRNARLNFSRRIIQLGWGQVVEFTLTYDGIDFAIPISLWLVVH